MDIDFQSNQALLTVLSVFSFVLGAMVGSFLNVCVHRLPAGESVIRPRSRCPKCLNSIAWYDNVPVVSWLMLGAKCRHCGQPISWQYPLVEVLSGLIFFGIFWRFGLVLATPIYMAVAAGLIVVTFVDLTTWTIPNEITLPGVPIGIGCALLGMVYPDSGVHVTDVFDSLIGVAVGGGSLYLLDQVTWLVLKKRGMGFGDVKLNAMLGAFFGWSGALLVIIIASFLGSIIGVTFILSQRGQQTVPADGDDEEELQGHYLPFGPYLAMAGIIVMFVGPQGLINLYLDFVAGNGV